MLQCAVNRVTSVHVKKIPEPRPGEHVACLRRWGDGKKN